MRRWIITLVPLLLSLVLITPALSQVEFSELQVEYRFGEYIDFTGEIPTDLPVQSVQIFIQQQGEIETLSSPPLIPENGQFQFRLDPNQEMLRAFSNLEYWYEVVLDDGKAYASPTGSLYYNDNRFEWQQRSASPFDVFWHEGDTAFGQSMLDISEQGLEQINTILPVDTPPGVKIYAYANPVDMRATLQVAGRNWVGAHTDPDLGVMVVSLPPGPEQRLEMERQIPHELMHILLYQKIGPAYVNLPAWLNEGLSSVAELYPNSDYPRLLDDAYKNGTLHSIASLCDTFPREATPAYLAYAESASFTRFLLQQYGSSGMERLINAYADGIDCQRALQVSLGAPLNQLELEWRRENFGEDPWQTGLSNLAPWLALFAAILLVPVLIVAGSLRRKPVQQEPTQKKPANARG